MKSLKPLLASAIPVLLVALILAAEPATETAAWQAGAASAIITPKQSLWMGGYASRTEPSEGVELDLFAKALVLSDTDGTKFALITLDLLGIPREFRLAVAERIRLEYGIDPSHLAINASHTHCGPEIRMSRIDRSDPVARRGQESASYLASLEDSLVEIVGEAAAASQPAHLDYSTARCGFSMNRRTPDGAGGWRNFPNPDGPVDQTVPVLKATRTDGKEIAIVFGYACHCTTLNFQKFSGDYAGYAQFELEKSHPGAVAMFANGCSGDQNPYPRRSPEYAPIHGLSLATAVDAALSTSMTRISGPIRAAYREIPLSYDTLPTEPELREREKSADKLIAAHAGRLLERIREEGSLPTSYPYPIQIIRLGKELTWLFLGGEVVVDYSLRLKKEMGDTRVWVSGYSNDVMAYIPSRRVWEEGGYEGGDAMIHGSHPTRWHGDLEDHIIGNLIELRESLE